MTLDSAGNLYGIAQSTGIDPDQDGLVYEFTREGQEKVLHYATGPAGVGYELAIDKSGNLYGSTFGGGPSHNGNVYKLTKQ